MNPETSSLLEETEEQARYSVASLDGSSHRGRLSVRHRKFPMFGQGSGVWSFLHIDDAAFATKLAIEGNAPELYNIVDDEPAEVSVWLPELARILDAKPPLHLPAWIPCMVLGKSGMSMMNTARGSSNAKAKRALGWQPRYSSWRDGFRRELASSAAAETAA